MIAAAALALPGCVSHPVGPARTYAKYEGKATTTAESALSAVVTASLAAEAGGRGNAFGPYLSVLLSEMEETASALEGTFASIQPPGPKADELRQELEAVLSDAVDGLGELRIAVRRGELRRLPEVAEPLTDVVKRLGEFLQAHK
jgi:hypothetical protein